MTDLETLERAKMYMEKLANGINPLDNSIIPDNDVVNNVRLSRCFFYIADVLRQVIDNGGVTKQKKEKKQPFYLSADQRDSFAYSSESIPISEITNRINALIPPETMKKLSHTMLTNWMLSIDLLRSELDANGKATKRPTSNGNSLGISVETRTGINGPYSVILYSTDAQHFILDNLDAVIDLANEKNENQGKPWSAEDDQILIDLHRQNTPMPEIANVLKRNRGAIRARLKKFGITL